MIRLVRRSYLNCQSPINLKAAIRRRLINHLLDGVFISLVGRYPFLVGTKDRLHGWWPRVGRGIDGIVNCPEQTRCLELFERASISSRPVVSVVVRKRYFFQPIYIPCEAILETIVPTSFLFRSLYVLQATFPSQTFLTTTGIGQYSNQSNINQKRMIFVFSDPSRFRGSHR